MRRIKWIALVLALAILFTGCSGLSFDELMGQLGAQAITPFSEMQYTLPDLEKMESALEDCCSAAETEDDKDALMEKVWGFYNLYNTFYTQNTASRGVAQAKAVLFFILVAGLSILQLRMTRDKEVAA